MTEQEIDPYPEEEMVSPFASLIFLGESIKSKKKDRLLHMCSVAPESMIQLGKSLLEVSEEVRRAAEVDRRAEEDEEEELFLSGQNLEP